MLQNYYIPVSNFAAEMFIFSFVLTAHDTDTHICNICFPIQASFHNSNCNSNAYTLIPINRISSCTARNSKNSLSLPKRFLSSTSSKQSTSSSSSSQSKAITNNSNASTKYFTTKTNQDAPTSIEIELSQLRQEIANLSYLIKQTASQQAETQTLARRAEARAYIIENKLIDIQSHVVKIPANLEKLVQNTRQVFKEYSPSVVSDAIRRVNESSASFLTSKYTLWTVVISGVVFWQYRLNMYQRTSEEVANVAAMTLKQDTLRIQIQETLTTVANSPETLESLSALFQKLITEKHTEEHLINLIVRALNSEGVRDAAIYLLDVAFQNEDLQHRAGEFLKVAANDTVLDETVQKNAGVGIQHALKSAVIPWWLKKLDYSRQSKDEEKEDSSMNSSEGSDTAVDTADESDNTVTEETRLEAGAEEQVDV